MNNRTVGEQGANPASLVKRLGLLVEFSEAISPENRVRWARFIGKTMKTDTNPLSVLLVAEASTMRFVGNGRFACIATAPNCLFDTKCYKTLKDWAHRTLPGVQSKSGAMILGVKVGGVDAMEKYISEHAKESPIEVEQEEVAEHSPC